MRVSVDYLVQDKKSGRYHYRRRVPKDMKAAIGKGEFYESLKTSDPAVAIRHYQEVHERVERQLATASGSADEIIRYEEDLKLLRSRKLIRRGAQEFVREPSNEQTIHETLHEEAKKQPDGVDPSPEFKRLVQLALMEKQLKRPDVRLRDALAVYLKEKANEFNDRTLSLDGERVIAALEEIVGERNPALVDLTIDDGYAFRDYWLGKGNSPDTARRRLNTINAIVNLSIRRHDIRNFNNPFSNIEVKGGREGCQAQARRFVGGRDPAAPAVR